MAKVIAAMGYRAVLFDQRGTGQSTLSVTDSTTLTMDLMVQDMEQIRNDLQVNKWVVLGHSFGGMLAYYYAAQHPERVSAMIQSSSGGMDLDLLDNARDNLFARLTSEEIDSLNHWRQALQSDESMANRMKYNGFLASAYVVDKQHVPTIQQRLMQGDIRLNRLVWQNMRQMQFDCKQQLRKFPSPVLIIQGRQDLIPIALATTAHEVLPQSSLALINNCGHYGWLDQPAEYFHAIERFLAANASKSVAE